jgi:hypothetical protein
MMSNEGFKLAAQRKKCLALVGAIDSVALSKDISPFDQAGRILMLLGEWKEPTWIALAKMAEVNLPSQETRAMVREVYRGRMKSPLAQMRAS